MAKKQTRRSISTKGITYQRVKNHCAAEGLSISGYLEALLNADLDAKGVPVPEKVDPRPSGKSPEQVTKIASQHFTF